MALRRDTARNLWRALNYERAFIDAVALEIESKRIKPKTGEKLIIAWFQNRTKVEYLIQSALWNEGLP